MKLAYDLYNKNLVNFPNSFTNYTTADDNSSYNIFLYINFQE